jgi:RNA polymerase sigma-70 factor (ECF subfamily)
MHPISEPETSPRPGADDADDEALLVGARLGDPAAAAAFVRRFQRRVYGLALCILRDSERAADIAEEALCRAWERAAAYDLRRGPVATWVLRITRNLAVDALRAQGAEPPDPQDLIVVLGSRAADEAGRLGAAVSRLPAEQRRALLLATFSGFTAAEIGAADGIPLTVARTRIRAGLNGLRAFLANDATPRQDRPDRDEERRPRPVKDDDGLMGVVVAHRRALGRGRVRASGPAQAGTMTTGGGAAARQPDRRRGGDASWPLPSAGAAGR